MKAPKKCQVENIAKELSEMVLEGMNGLPAGEQEDRLTSFFESFSGKPRKRPTSSRSSSRAQGRLATRVRA
jgi:hypothetical protein